MAYKFINMMMIFLIFMIVGTIIASPVNSFTKNFEHSLLKTALESNNANSPNHHVYQSGELVDAKKILRKTNLLIPEILLKNYNTDFNHINGRSKRHITESYNDPFTDMDINEYIDKIFEQEIENGYTGNFPNYEVKKEDIPYGTRFIITYYKGDKISCSTSLFMCSCKYIYGSVCTTIVEHPYGSEIDLQNIVYSHCEDIKNPSN